ncbi:MAG TPA: bifunctional phosphoribosylaminoimidazolecarboxamide formyltransferase/IMP cyclohydrolase [Thermoplasmata archaeon]|nr:bifunctional phosphoribosylaminoimidazolecarboxamide formyltransferase/IMP cyclohydrolase [Thermoplasmata archaeon]
MATEPTSRTRIERALLSVDDKTGLGPFAHGLSQLGVELWATGGTRRALAEAHVPVRPAEELTGIASWFGGRVKTLHPGLLGGILAPRTDAGRKELAERKLLPFDLVIVNFYPFERHLAEHPGASDLEEYIDIGGVTLARAAAKNHAFVTVVSDPTDYDLVLAEMRSSGGTVSAETRRRLAVRAFERCTSYDAAIFRGLRPATSAPDVFPEELVFRREPVRLRYGENPHQKAATFAVTGSAGSGLTPKPFTVLKGEGLSFTNFLDVDTALAVVGEFSSPAAAVVKHATPCGVATAPTLAEAISLAVATDSIARYGCVVAVNRPLGEADPAALKGVFVDLLAAPEFHPAALEALGHRAKVKVVRTAPPSPAGGRWEAKSALGRLLLQESDVRQLGPNDWKHITGPEISEEQRRSLEFAWKVVRHAKSNAIVLAQGSATVGIGSGQTSRVKASEIAVEIAGDRAKGAVLASDAFFPFPDGVEVPGKAGVAAILQPGGSIRDPEVIETAKKYGVSMYFTGWRVFRH